MKKKRETSKTKTVASRRAGAIGAVVSTPTKYTLDSLVPLLGPFEEAVRTAIFDLVSEQVLLKRGQRVDSDRILEDVPLFLGSAYGILQGLSEAQRKRVNLGKHILALCLDETLKLRMLHEGHQVAAALNAGDRAEGRVDERQSLRALRASRRSLLASLTNGLDEGAQARAKQLAGKASTKKSLVQGSERLADDLTKTIETASESQLLQLGSFDITAERIAELRQNIEDVSAAISTKATRAGRVEQRLLDIQDGRVLVLLERIVRAFRAARNQDSTILVPELRALMPYFTSRPGKNPPKTPRPPQPQKDAKTAKTPPAPLDLSPMPPAETRPEQK